VSETPFVGFTNATLADLPPLQAGDEFTCPACGAQHVARPVAGRATLRMLVYRCPQRDGVLLAGVAGRNVAGVEPDVSSSDSEATAVLCDVCWEMRHPGVEPTRLTDAPLEPCLRCRLPTLSGIYVLRKHWALPV
jgi:predicted RNA-binding Zn-ribbon protein involved in translation (DUF1610 family)